MIALSVLQFRGGRGGVPLGPVLRHNQAQAGLKWKQVSNLPGPIWRMTWRYCGSRGICNELEWFAAIRQWVTPEVIVHGDATAGNVPVERKKKKQAFKHSQRCRNTLMLCLSGIKYSTMRFQRPRQKRNMTNSQTVIILETHHCLDNPRWTSENHHLSFYYRQKPTETFGLNQLELRSKVRFITPSSHFPEQTWPHVGIPNSFHHFYLQ